MFKGIFPAMITPFKADETLNENVLIQLIHHFIEKGVHGILATGSNGEAYALSNAERKRIWKTTAEAAKGTVKILAGTGQPSTRETIVLSKQAEETGVDGVLVLPPIFVQPNEKELASHFIAVADAVSVPVMIYNNPARTHTVIPAPLIAELVQHPNIPGMKDSSCDLSFMMEVFNLAKDDITVLCGCDSIIAPALQIGASGAIAATANVTPGMVVAIYDAFQNGDLALAQALQTRLFPLRNAFQLGTYPGVIKRAMNLLGFEAGPTRAPVGPLSPQSELALKEILDQVMERQ